MKNYNEMANDVLRRIGEHETEQRNRRKTIGRIVTPLCCFCLVALLGFGVWQGGVFNTTPPAITGEQSQSGGNDHTDPNASVGKDLFSINEITGTISAALKYRDPALHYNETWDPAKAAAYLGVDIPKVVENFPDGDTEAGSAQAFPFKPVAGNEFKVIYENNGTLVEDSMCYEFIGGNDAKVRVLASKLRMPYDCLYWSDTDDVTSIRIPETDEIVSVRVYAQSKTDASDYTLLVGDFEYHGVFYRIHLENLTDKHLDALIREIVK